MRKDWLLIRAILLDITRKDWPANAVSEHLTICLDAKYISVPKSALWQFPGSYHERCLTLTALGSEVAERLVNYDDVDDVLQELDEQNLGAPSDLLFSMLRERALKRLGRQEKPAAKRPRKTTRKRQ